MEYIKLHEDKHTEKIGMVITLHSYTELMCHVLTITIRYDKLQKQDMVQYGR